VVQIKQLTEIPVGNIKQEKTGKSEQEANRWLDDLTVKNRYMVDIWGIQLREFAQRVRCEGSDESESSTSEGSAVEPTRTYL
jgi:hypothetical protein